MVAGSCTTHPSSTDTGRLNRRLAAQINANTVDMAVASASPIVDLVKLINLHTDLNVRCVGTVADLLDCAKSFGPASVAFVRAHMRMPTQVDTEDNDDEGLAALVAANYAGAFLDEDDDSWPIPIEPSTLHPNSESWDSAIGFFPFFPAAAYETGMQFAYVDILGRRAAVSEPSMVLFSDRISSTLLLCRTRHTLRSRACSLAARRSTMQPAALGAVGAPLLLWKLQLSMRRLPSPRGSRRNGADVVWENGVAYASGFGYPQLTHTLFCYCSAVG